MSKKAWASLLIVLLTYINGPFFFIVITPLHRAFYYAVSVFPLFYAVYRGFRCDINIRNFSLLSLFFFCTIIFVQMVTGAYDFQYLIAFIRSLLNILGTISVFAIYQYLKARNKIAIGFREITLKSVVFYIMGSIVFLCVPSLKAFWSSIITDFQSVDFTNFLEYITRYGFAGFSGFGFTYWVTACAVVFCYMYINGELKESQSRIYIIFLLIGSFFYGRTGFVVTVFFFVLLTFYSLFHRKRKLFIFFIFIVLFFIAVGFILYFTVPDIQPFIDWLLEPILNYLEGGKVETASTNGLKKFYENFHPTDKTLFLGDGYWIDPKGGYYGHTDVGFMRNIYYGGVFFTAIQYILVFAIILFVSLWMKNNNKKGVLFIPFLMLMDFVLFELKGDSAFMCLKQFLPFYLGLVYSKKNDYCLVDTCKTCNPKSQKTVFEKVVKDLPTNNKEILKEI